MYIFFCVINTFISGIEMELLTKINATCFLCHEYQAKSFLTASSPLRLHQALIPLFSSMKSGPLFGF